MGGHLAPVLVQGVCSMDTAARERRGRSELFSSNTKYLDIYPQGKLQFCALEMIRQSVLSCPIPAWDHCPLRPAPGRRVTNDNPISRNISIIGPIICLLLLLLLPPALSATKTSFLATQNCTALSDALRRNYRKNATSK